MKVNREWKSKGTDRPGINRTRAAPRRSDIMPASSSSPSHPSGGDEGKSKGANRTRRDRTSAKDAAAIFASSSPLFCSVCCPHRPHHRQPLTGSHHKQRRWKSGHPDRLWGGCHRHHLATTSPPIDQQPDGQRRGLSVILPASHLPLRQVVRV